MSRWIGELMSAAHLRELRLVARSEVLQRECLAMRAQELRVARLRAQVEQLCVRVEYRLVSPAKPARRP